ncbi:MAG: TIGR02996 domain-containing protein [Kofleriaceae bacterium]
MVRNLELERRLADHPDDRESYEVLADWLQTQGDPRGELIALVLRAEQAPSAGLATQISAHEQRHANELRGAGFAGALQWRRGFVSHVSLDRARLTATVAEVLDAILAHPSGALVDGIQIFDTSPTATLAKTLDVIARRAPRSLRMVQLLVDAELPSLSAFDRLPHLATLAIERAPGTGGLGYGNLFGPGLGLTPEAMRQIAHAEWPLHRLVLDLGYGRATFADMRPLFVRDDLAITELRINAPIPDRARDALGTDLCRALVASPLAGQLEAIELNLELSSANYRALVEGRHRFARLRRLALPSRKQTERVLDRSARGYDR